VKQAKVDTVRYGGDRTKVKTWQLRFSIRTWSRRGFGSVLFIARWCSVMKTFWRS